MDIMTGLAAASQAVGLITQIRDLDKAIDEAAFKAKLLELQEAVFEAKSSLLDAKQAAQDKDQRIEELEGLLKAATNGENCPVCGNGTLKVTAVRDHPSLGEVGVKIRALLCTNEECLHREDRVFDPLGLLKA